MKCEMLIISVFAIFTRVHHIFPQQYPFLQKNVGAGRTAGRPTAQRRYSSRTSASVWALFSQDSAAAPDVIVAPGWSLVFPLARRSVPVIPAIRATVFCCAGVLVPGASIQGALSERIQVGDADENLNRAKKNGNKGN